MKSFGGDAEGDTFDSIEFIIGSNADDTIRGNARRKQIYGNDGDDIIEGGVGREFAKWRRWQWRSAMKIRPPVLA